MAPRNLIIKVHLYCPSLSLDILDYLINLSHSDQVIREKIGGALLTSRPCFAYDTKQLPILDFATLEPGQTLLIGVSHFERPLPETRKDVKMLQGGRAEEKWMQMDVLLKKNVVEGLRKDDRRAKMGEIIYLTLPFHIAVEKIKAISTSSSSPATAASTSAKECLAKMQENWDAPVEAALGLESMVMPYGDVESWEKGLLEMLAVLSEVTVGQVGVVATLIVEQVRKRGGGGRGKMIVEMGDVREVVEVLFRRGL